MCNSHTSNGTLTAIINTYYSRINTSLSEEMYKSLSCLNHALLRGISGTGEGAEAHCAQLSTFSLHKYGHFCSLLDGTIQDALVYFCMKNATEIIASNSP